MHQKCLYAPSSLSLSLPPTQTTKTPGLRPLTEADVVGVHSLLQANQLRFHLSSAMSLQEAEHWLSPRENVVDTYVVEVWPS